MRCKFDNAAVPRSYPASSAFCSTAESKIQENTLKVHDQAKKRLEHESGLLRQNILKQRFIVAQMQSERDR